MCAAVIKRLSLSAARWSVGSSWVSWPIACATSPDGHQEGKQTAPLIINIDVEVDDDLPQDACGNEAVVVVDAQSIESPKTEPLSMSQDGTAGGELEQVDRRVTRRLLGPAPGTPHSSSGAGAGAGQRARSRDTLAQQLRRQARRSLAPAPGEAVADVAPAPKQQRTRRRANRFKQRRALDACSDDDSAQENARSKPLSAPVLARLQTSDAAVARRISFKSSGILVSVDGVDGCSDKSVQLSSTVAMALAGGVEPTSCVALQSGRLAPLPPAAGYQLQRAGDCWRLLADSRCFFNFELGRWQPLHLSRAVYGRATGLLYVAFVPEPGSGPARGGPALFVKLGYRELPEEDDPEGHDALIGYIEGKTEKLRITNVPGAGVFVFKPPAGHRVFARPCRAAETSLKTELLHSGDIAVTPSGHYGENCAFSASLEYLFVEAAADRGGRGQADPLAALTRALRSFTGSHDLTPQRAKGFGWGGLRWRRKRLRPWPQSLDCPGPGGSAEGASGPQPARDLARDHAEKAALESHAACALRSRAKRARLDRARLGGSLEEVGAFGRGAQ